MIKTLRTGQPILLFYLRMSASQIYGMDAWRAKIFQFMPCVSQHSHIDWVFLSFSQCREVGSLNNLNRFLDSHFLNLDPKLLDKVDRSTDDAMDTDGPMDGR